MLEALDLVGIRGEHRLFDHLTFRIAPGECLLVQGENGSGKTTLLRSLAGFATPDAGRVLWKGKPLRNQWSEYQRELVYSGHGIGLKEDLNALETCSPQPPLQVSHSPRNVWNQRWTTLA